MGVLAAQSALLAIGIILGLICSAIGLFFGHIILFDSIALGIVAGVCCRHFLSVHPALCIVIGIGIAVAVLATKPLRWILDHRRTDDANLRSGIRAAGLSYFRI